jgi:sugar/nucleoside kinase (ribokinase family)
MQEDGLETGVNIVLIDHAGERHFLTNPKGRLRKLSVADVEPYLHEAADIVSFASVFVSPLLDMGAMEEIFRKIKERPGRILVADMTKPKNGEGLEDVEKWLPYVDFFMPNEEELTLLTGEKDAYKNAELLVETGVKCVVIKRGKAGCLIRTKEDCFEIPAYPVEHVVDTTGAGDCFVAGFLWGLSKGLSLEECGRMACATASCAVEAVGATEGIHAEDSILSRCTDL